MIYKQIFLEVHYVAAVKFKKEWLLLLPSFLPSFLPLICYSLLFGLITFFTALPLCSQEFGGWKMISEKGPSARHVGCIAYDQKREKIVLFGGSDYTKPYNDTWEWDGTQWTKINVDGPSPRWGSTMVYDPEKKVIILFGGAYSNTPNNDIWEYNGIQWKELKVNSTIPKPRRGHVMVYDENRKVMIMFGGADNYEFFNDTWVWDGKNWKFETDQVPSARAYSSMVYDSKRKHCILFGGVDTEKEIKDTWAYDGIIWTQIKTDMSPKPCHASMMVYDSLRQRSILFGGVDETSNICYGDTWEWDGNQWWYITPSGPTWRLAGSIAYNYTNGKTFLFGGRNIKDKITYFGDTWEYTPKTLPIPEKTYKLDSESEFTRMSGGFMNAQAGSVEVGSIPAMEGFSDGKGVTLTAGKGQVELLMFPTMDVGDNMIMLRASVQSNNGGAALALAALDGGMDGSIATNQPANSNVYFDKYQRMVVVYDPPGNTIVPIFQLANLSNLIPVTVYLDNIEIFLLPREDYRRFYGE